MPDTKPEPFFVKHGEGGIYLAGLATTDEGDWDVLKIVLARLKSQGLIETAFFEVSSEEMLAFRLGSFPVPDGVESNDPGFVAELLETRLNEEAVRVITAGHPEYFTLPGDPV